MKIQMDTICLTYWEEAELKGFESFRSIFVHIQCEIIEQLPFKQV